MAGKAAMSGGSIVLAVLVTVAAPLAGYAAVRQAALETAGTAVDPTAKLPPRSVVPPLKALMRIGRRPGERLPRHAAALARRAALKLPLAYEPYFVAAKVEEQAGRYGTATILMEEARRRRPNGTSIHIALLGYYSLADAYQKAIDAADVAMRIDGRSMSLILPAFAKLTADPKARRAIAVALAKDPPWRDAFLEAATNAKISPAIAKALVAEVRGVAPSRKVGAEEVFLVRSLVGAGKFREARALWEGYRPAAAANGSTVTDGEFTGATALPPFNWTLRESADGTAEIAKASQGGPTVLEVDYFGDEQAALAEQILAAKPGNYRLSTVYSGSSSGADVKLSWRLTCLPSGQRIATLPLQPFAEGVNRREATVTIAGAGCEGQVLALVGEPGDVTRSVSAQIDRVALTPFTGGRTR